MSQNSVQSNKSDKYHEKSQCADENPIVGDKKTEDIDLFETKQKIKMQVDLLAPL